MCENVSVVCFSRGKWCPWQPSSYRRANIHTHFFPLAVWLMRPEAGDGSIKEVNTPPPLCFPPLPHALRAPTTHTWLIAAIWLRKGEMGNWKMVWEDWKQCADYKPGGETKGLPSISFLVFGGGEAAGVCRTGAWLRRTKRHYERKQMDAVSVPGCILGW